MGGDIVPDFVEPQRGLRLRLQGQPHPRARLDRDRGYWRDVGTHRLLLRGPDGARVDPPGVQPLQLRVADLHRLRPLPAGQVRQGRQGKIRARPTTRPSPPAWSSAAPTVTNSVLSPRCHVHSFATIIDDSVLLDGVDVGRNAVVRSAPSSTRTSACPRGVSIGVDPEADLARGFHVTNPASPSSARAWDQRVTQGPGPVHQAPLSAGGPAPRPDRRPAPAAARGLRPDPRARSRQAEESRRRRRLQLGPLLPAVRRAGGQALRVLDDAGGLGGGDRAGRDRRAGHLQHLPQPRSCSPTWPAPSTTSATAGSSSASARAGSRRTTTSTATSSARPVGGSTPSTATCRWITERAGSAQPAARPGTIPVLVGGGGERKTLRIVAQNADIWHGFGDAEDHRAQAPRCSTTGASGWAATPGDRALLGSVPASRAPRGRPRLAAGAEPVRRGHAPVHRRVERPRTTTWAAAATWSHGETRTGSRGDRRPPRQCACQSL